MGRALPTSTPWRALVLLVALAAAVGLIAQAAGALGGLERASEEARFESGAPSRPGTWPWWPSTPRPSATCAGNGRSRAPCTAGCVRRLHAAGARQVVYDVQFTEPSEPREDESLYRALGDTGGAILATSESDGRGHTRVLGGDENLRAVHSRAAASDLTNAKGTVTRFPRDAAGLDTLATAAARRAGARPRRPRCSMTAVRGSTTAAPPGRSRRSPSRTS